MTIKVKQITEARRIISKHEFGNRKAVVYKNPETDEHQVEFHEDGKHLPDATYYDNGDKDGKEAAQSTADNWVKKGEQTKVSEDSLKKLILNKLSEKMSAVDEMKFIPTNKAALFTQKHGAGLDINNPEHRQIIAQKISRHEFGGKRVKVLAHDNIAVDESVIDEAWSDGAKRLAGAAVLSGAIAAGVSALDKTPPKTIWHNQKQYTVLQREPSTRHDKPKRTLTIDGIKHYEYSGNTILPVSKVNK